MGPTVHSLTLFTNIIVPVVKEQVMDKTRSCTCTSVQRKELAENVVIV